jgi:hypothetical protein
LLVKGDQRPRVSLCACGKNKKRKSLFSFQKANQKSATVPVTSNLTPYAWRKKKLITQFGCKSRDKSFEPNKSMIGHKLSNKTKSATVAESKLFRQLNKPKEEEE